MANISVTLALHVSKWNAIRKCSYAICPAATGHRILGSTLQSDGGTSTEIHKRTQCGWNNHWRKMSLRRPMRQESTTTREGKDKQDDRSASNAVRDGDSASH